MPKPVVAVVGRPNVGKSTLFNRIAGARVSIVEDTPGVTRDRIYADAEWSGHNFLLVDTGGLAPKEFAGSKANSPKEFAGSRANSLSDDMIKRHIYAQAELAIGAADVIVFVVSVKDGVTDDDEYVASLLRRARKPVILAVNKVDDFAKYAMDAYEFFALGLGDPVPISAGQRLGLGDLLDKVVESLPGGDGGGEVSGAVKVAVVGKPNTGKSSLINRVLGEDRVIVSPTPGTTRDAIDSRHVRGGREYVFIDTAGMRRKSKIRENIERYSVIRSVAAIERADVCVLMLDAAEGVTEQDTKVAGMIHESGKGAVIAVNKWDAIEKDGRTMKLFEKRLETDLIFMPYAPRTFISALTGQRVGGLFQIIDTVYENSLKRVSTGALNEALLEATAVAEPPQDKGRALRIYYMTQVSVAPPTFVMFVNDPELLHFSYKRFLENRLRMAFGFDGTPIRLIARERKE
ncbi:MAG: ribosome biogenesis GTPase Der [Clostridiales bacterium]|jgi:GTP-binding protein|nr:ribosome biogenesis GTPase Der [Clostridiales bacterium]